MIQKNTLNFGRRFFLKLASMCGITVTGTFIPAIFTGCENDTTKSSDKSVELDISTQPALQNGGSAAKITFGENNNGRPVIVIRLAENEFVVLTSVCAHLGCEVDLPDGESGIIVCPGPCGHGSQYSSSNGAVLRGPTTAPLTKYVSTFDPDSGKLTITF